MVHLVFYADIMKSSSFITLSAVSNISLNELEVLTHLSSSSSICDIYMKPQFPTAQKGLELRLSYSK